MEPKTPRQTKDVPASSGTSDRTGTEPIVTGRSKMPIEQRAKQFMPFAALPGLDEALAAVEDEMEASNSESITLRTTGIHVTDN